ncbi:YitT family protein [Shinella yambaruensis]|uniref:Membrane protein n=1 Tax=Shinella yambaruensis TaxID=415996 RepID=A0ABQ5ZDT7_9HYPH|nr:YitT family protein [Shinella yambaruensis]MCJ8025718.1 YitT family protein [Shinella yambaruensis]MCU7978560.1 YitT family protein [Shinella yambaruensis]GLR50012.1 membrane protein [Shinella yambaruensis]
MSVETAARPERHSACEDAIAIVVGTMFMALGVVIYTKAVLLAGSTAGLALLLQYASGIGFWWLFFAINLPFYVLAVRKLGWAFTLRTFAAVTLVSIFTRLTSELVSFSHLDPLYAAVMGGALSGTGLLILFRHRTGLGGINVLAIYLQDRFGIRAGYFQLAVDLAILAAAVFVIPLDRLALSVLGAVVVNMTLAINHRPGRYLGVT